MKKLFLFTVAMSAWTAASGQTNFGQYMEVNYYGVDFSRAKTFGASETGAQFVKAFGDINTLVIGEWKKYNVAKYLNKQVAIQDIAVAQRANNSIDQAQIPTTSSMYSLTNEDIAAMVKAYDIRETNGTGLVILGELLNKQNNRGSYVVVLFDIASREVLYHKSMQGKAGGFGLRNFWAGALYNVLKMWRY